MIETKQLTINDIEDIFRVEYETWGEELSANRKVLTNRLRRFPKGFIGGYIDGRLAGMIYGHPINKISGTWYENSCKEAFNPNGEIYYIVNLGVSKNSQHKGIGSKLLEETIRIASNNGFSRILLGSRNVDSNINFYLKNGFTKIETINSYLPEDKESKGVGILMEYPIS
jgi:ribosomal protein S18 acetylase RimI-like enzyme